MNLIDNAALAAGRIPSHNPRLMTLLRTILNAAAELIYPRSCLACDQSLGPDETDWCAACTTRLLAATNTSLCPRCAAPAEPHLLDPTGCRSCRGRSTPLEQIACVGLYGSFLGELVRTYKYRGRQQLDLPLAKLLAASITATPWVRRLDAIVPVPASLRERLHYRFWPVGLLAEAAGRILHLPALPVLAVHGKRRRQVDLPPSQRVANIRGTFHVRRGARLPGARLCVIDDVITSGATLREAARTLKKAGAATVYAAVLARAGMDSIQTSTAQYQEPSFNA